MRAWLARMPVSAKLLALTLAVASLGILSGSIVLLMVHQSMVREEIENGFATLVSSASEYCVGPLVFDDRDGADQVLDKFRSNPSIVGATLLDANHRVVSKYAVPGRQAPTVSDLEPGIRRHPDYLLAVQPIQHQGRSIGALVVSMSTVEIKNKLARETFFTLAMSLLLIAGCGLIAARLQRFVTAPLVNLAATMRGIKRSSDLAARVSPPTRDEVGTLYEGFNTMLAELQAREQERDRIEMHLRALLDALPDEVFVLDRNGLFHEALVPDRARAISGDDALVGKKLSEVMPADVADALLAAVRETIATGQSQRLEYSIEGPTGTRSLEAVSSIVGSAGTEPTGPWVLIISRDVSERRDLERQLRQSSKMDAVGRLAGGVAHDFNNLLTGIIGYAELLRMLGDPRSQSYAEKILGASHRASDLVRQLLAFSRRSEPALKPTQVVALVESVAGILRHTVDPRIVIRVDAASSPSVRADPAQLETAILNLALNARDAMGDGGELTMRVSAVELGDAELGLDGFPLPRGPYVEISVKDTGSGIEPSLRSRIFEPFFTTKATGKGTGLGLAAVYGTVKNHGGTIRLQTEVGRGTEVSILLPRLRSDDVSVPAPVPAVAAGAGHILVVDDEEFVREVSVRYLQDLGYRVSEAVDGQDALDVFDREGGDLDLVILDLVMPRLHGAQVLQVLRRRAPSLPVLLVSGHAVGEQVTEARRQADGFLQKPFRPGELACEVQRLLAASRDGTLVSQRGGPAADVA